jgi:hypothetical protein
MNTLFMKSIRKEFTVDAPQSVAFDTFTQEMDLWWPRTHHIGKTPMIELVLEPGVNGRWYSRHEDGSEVNIGRVLEWDPYAKLILAWQVNGSFAYDKNLLTEVEVDFITESPEKTRVILEHRDLDRLGEGKAIESMDQGWGMIMDLYRQTVVR